jgi:hypothetical protein
VYKEFEQCDWWRAKVYPPGLHTRGQCSKDDTFQNAYMAILLVTFSTKSLFGGGKFVPDIYKNPNSP